MNIGKTIAALRRREVMTQEELAEKIGVTPQSISKWETGILSEYKEHYRGFRG